ncbi:hypothetical protein [Streptomyces sp. NBC_01373]|uniref:hypothetical protein n=1 Tax=Streptomyces sp. NBC_01373 TaxID=2903843 RepID=UPI0022570540|nr:hypothetical protein [Streptomyces sp. NBC_01373]MCX4701203.1 hypothetical protein [Streptomyces sp. NBC_01373]
MSDASTNHHTADVQESTGHGRHRGPVSVQHDGEAAQAAPRGRHRKPVGQTKADNAA